MRTYRPHVLVRLWLRLVMPCFLVLVSAGMGVAEYQHGGLSVALPYWLASGLLGAAAFAIDSRVAWTLQLDDGELSLLSRWRPVTVPSDSVEVVELTPWPGMSMRVIYPYGQKTLPRLRDEEQFLIHLKKTAPSVAVRV